MAWATSFIAATLVFSAAPALAEPILGTWRLSNGETVTYSRCSEGFCSVVDSGQYKGRSVGRMTGSAPRYDGTVIDPSNGKSYAGYAEVEARRLVLTGCVAKVFCRSQTWTR